MYEQYIKFYNQPLDSCYADIFTDRIYLSVGLNYDGLGILVVVGGK